MKRLIRMIILSFFTLAVLVVSSYAWFTNSQFVEPNISGYSVAAYFGGGDGSTSAPFKIKNQRHLYNLAWLQYLGYFNKKGSGIVENPNANTLTHYSFSIENDINMDGWKLPPIGTSYNPFIGSLDGNGHTISNLETTNDFGDLDKHPGVVTAENFGNKDTQEFQDPNSNSCSVIGFIGSIGQTTNMNYAGLGITTPTFTNLVLNNNTVSTSTAETLVGSVAGYVNGTISDVGVRIPTLNVNTNAAVTSLSSKTSNLSDFAVVGYAEKAYTTALTKRTTTIYNPTTSYSHFSFNGMGNTTEWGGSIDMRSLYLRTNAKINNTEIPNYVSGEINYYDENNELIENKTITVRSNTNTTYGRYYGASFGASGSYFTYQTAPFNGYDYLTALYKTVIDIKITGTANGFKIMNYSGNYLNMTSTRAGNNSLNFNVTLSSNTDSDSATVWIQKSKSGGGYSIRTYNKDDGYEYYLNATTTALSISSSDNTTWNLDSNLGYYIENGGKKYYLRYLNGNNNGGWTISDKLAYYITDNDNHYLSRNGGNIVNQNDYTDATRWIFQYEDTNPYGIIYDESNTNYKLNINGTTLNATTNNTATSWLNNGNNIYNGSNYIIYDNGWKLYQPNQFYIKYNNSYLSLNTNGTINHNITNQNEATIWTFSDVSGNPKGCISTSINDTTYYLRLNNGNLEVTTVQNQRTNWSNTGDGLYSTYNNNNYYIQYKNNQWVTMQLDPIGYQISYDGYYLHVNGTSITQTTNQNVAALWNFDSNNYIYTNINGTNYYLYATYDDTPDLTTNPSNPGGYGIIVRNGNYLEEEEYPSYRLNYTSRDGWSYSRGNYSCNIIEKNTNSIGEIGDTKIDFKTYAMEIQPNYTSFSSTTYTYEPTQRPETVPSVFNYIPINTDENYNVKDTNTGYIMAGGRSGASGQFKPTGSNTNIALEHVDIRTAGQTSAYVVNGRISTSVNNDGTFKQDMVYTYNGSITKISDSGSTIYASNNQTQKFYKYSASKNSLQQTLTTAPSYNGSKYLSGIHFITSQISLNHLITAPSVLINGTTYNNYEMPEDSIDFQLKQKGYINFFAGLYYPGNTSFFALYDIKRDSNNKIIAINHIKEIYQNNSDLTKDYIYKYESVDSTTGKIYSGGNSNVDGYTKIFDTSWIETPNIPTGSTGYDKQQSGTGYKNNGYFSTKLFYFEIPVNKGEFALGSVNGRDGGYLLYLDIGANAAAVDRTTITQETKTVVSDYKYVNGIQILADTGNITSISAANSAVAVIKTTSNVSEVSISRTGDTISFGTLNNNVLTPFTNNLDVSYKSEDISLSGAELKALEENETNKKVLKYLDYNRATESLYQTIINNDGTTNTDYEVYRLNPTTMEKTGDILDYNGMDINDRMNATYGLLMIDTTSSSVPAGKRVDNFTSVAITTSTNPAVLKYDLYTNTANKDNVEETIEMVVTRVTGNQTVYNLDNNINDITVTNGRLTLSDNYLAEFLYRLQGNTITITSVEETTVTVKEINRANNTYTFIFKTYDGTTYEVTAVGNTVTIPASQ